MIINMRLPQDPLPKSSTSLKIAIVGPDAQRLADFTRALRGGTNTIVVETVGAGAEQLLIALSRHAPDILVFDAAGHGSAALLQIERAERLYPDPRVILISDDQSAEFLTGAMRARVCEVLRHDVAVAALEKAVQRVAEKWVQPQSGKGKGKGKVVTFVSCKGGNGATFILTNIAHELAELGQRTIVIDLNLQWGDAALLLTDNKPKATLANITEQIDRVDAVYLKACLQQVHPNLGVLAAPEDPVSALSVRPEHIDVLLRLACNNFDYVLVDCGPTLDAVNVRALDYADLIVPVLQISVPVIRDGKRLIDVLRSLNYREESLRPIVNRYDRGGPIPLQQLEEALGLKVWRTFPSDYESVSNAINQGVPVNKSARHSAIARGLREAAEALAAAPAVESKRNWFERVFKRA